MSNVIRLEAWVEQLPEQDKKALASALNPVTGTPSAVLQVMEDLKAKHPHLEAVWRDLMLADKDRRRTRNQAADSGPP